MLHFKSPHAFIWTAFLLASLAAPSPTAAAPLPQAPGWSRLTTVSPGDPIVVMLFDGRRLERRIVGADAEGLVVVDLSRVTSREGRQKLLALLRQDPARFSVSASEEAKRGGVELVERLDRPTIATVARPRPYRFQPPGVLGWLLAFSGPCPNCDATQTLSGKTVFPSPLGATDPGEVLYAAVTVPATDLPADVTWEGLREWLSQKPGTIRAPTATHK